MSAIIIWMAWCEAIGTPKVLRSRAYLHDSSRQRRISPAADAAIIQGTVYSVIFFSITLCAVLVFVVEGGGVLHEGEGHRRCEVAVDDSGCL